MASQTPDIHFLLVPLMSQSHLIPMIDFAKLLAIRGFQVTVISTPLNSARFEPSIDQAMKMGHKIKLIPIRFPCQEAGLPEGCENFDTVTSPDLTKVFYEANKMLQGPVEKLVSEMEPRVNCIISSTGFSWAGDIAMKFDLPWYVFNTVSCYTLLLVHNLSLESVRNISVKFNDSVEKMRKADQLANGRLINTFEEMERSYVDEYKLIKKKTWCIGPVSLADTETSDKFNRGNKTSVDHHICLDWLDSRKPSSVVYACFGSQCHVPFSQLIEIGLGLEASCYNFIWVIRACDYSEDFDKWMKDENFDERNRSRGLVIRGWAPQVLILTHISTGGFITHCGWNSILEGISAGVPLITWPMFAEQFGNEKFVTQVLGTGVKIGVEVGMEWGKEKSEVMVKRENVKKAIDLLMSEGEEGCERRKRARELGEEAKKAVHEGGSSYSNILLFIKDVIQHIDQNNS